MGVVIVFIPCDLYRAGNSYLFGVVRLINASTVFYILGHSQKPSVPESHSNHELIGAFHSGTKSLGTTPLGLHWLDIRLLNNEFAVLRVNVNQKDTANESTPVISVIIDPHMFQASELFEDTNHPPIVDTQPADADFFKTLISLLRDLKQGTSKNSNAGISHHEAFLKVLSIILRYLNLAFLVLQKIFVLLRLSAICCHFVYLLENLIWCLSAYITEKKLTLKAGNYVFGRILDSIFGILALYYLMDNFTKNELLELMANLSEDIVMKLRIIIHWLMGSPAGLKLNAPYTDLLGQFFLYHVNLWWSFLVVTRPVLEFMYKLFLRIGLLGLSFQIAILSDLLVIVSFHVYCIYVYAARLYNFQLKFLSALFRLVIGRKRNPLPGQVDSHPYTTEQLFLGTLAFTILLFLLPTTFVYYLMFAGLRAALVAIGGLLARLNFLLQTLPVYVVFQWLFNSSRTTNSICLRPKTVHTECNRLVLYVMPITTSLWSIIKSTIPDTVKFPAKVDWPHIIQSLISGRLIYTI